VKFFPRIRLCVDKACSNVERLACIWQDLHPGDAPDNFVNLADPAPGHAGPDPDADLVPFHDENGKHYTSTTVRDWRPLGYTYPELQKWLPQYKRNGVFDSQTYVSAVRAKVDVLYPTTAKSVLRLPGHEGAALVHLKALPSLPAGSKVSHVAAAQKPMLEVPAPSTTSSTPERWEENDYVVNVLYEK
jgi:hypothetical protein